MGWRHTCSLRRDISELAMDFAVLPLEINSGRMYSGAGAGSMISAAVVWDGLSIRSDDTAAALSATTQTIFLDTPDHSLSTPTRRRSAGPNTFPNRHNHIPDHHLSLDCWRL